MTPVNSLKHQSQQKSKLVVHKEYIIAFDPLLSVWPLVSCKWFIHQVCLRVPRGRLHKYSIASLNRWWVLPPLGASRQRLSIPEWTQLPLEDQRCVVCSGKVGKRPFSPCVCCLRDPKQSCLCHMSSYTFFWRGSLKQLIAQCPISTQPSVSLGDEIGE